MGKKRKSRKQIKKLRARSVLVGILGIFLLVSAYVVYSKQSQIIEPGKGVLATPVDVHDFGLVPVSKGVVSVELPLVNIGEEELIISFLDSSCGCTTAKVINGDKSGPVFGMSSHGKSPKTWRSKISPGEQALLKIYYDPSVHPKFRGQAIRVITITSNEELAPEKQVRIKVNQVD